MARKGQLAEILSKAQHQDDPSLNLVGFLDFGEIREVTLPEFLRQSENFQVIPATRISYVKRLDKTLYSRKMVKKQT